MLVSSLTSANTMLVGQYAFELSSDSSNYNLDNYLRAVQTAYFNTEPQVYEIYYSVLTSDGLKWIDLVSEDMTPRDNLESINGNGKFSGLKNIQPPSGRDT